MSSTARRSAAIVLFALVNCCALAKAKPPRILQDPVFGLRYSVEKVKFDPLPAEIKAKCPELESKRWGRQLWIYAQATEGKSTYYVVGGYAINRFPSTEFPKKFEIDTVGAMFHVDGEICKLIGPPREEFQARPTEDIAPTILQQLGGDLVKRFTNAFGGIKALGAEFERQHLAPADVSPELEMAFKRIE